jgi:hypothetical protein
LVNIINTHDDFLVGHIEPNTEVDILISLGDLYDVTLQKDVDVYAPVLYLDVFEIHPPPLSKLPQRRHKILKAMRFMVSGVADDETSFDRCGAFCRRGGNKRCLNGCRNAAAHASQGRCGVADFWGRVRGNFFGRKI